MQSKIYSAAAILSSLLAFSGEAVAVTNPDAYSPQNVLIGATPTLQASANYGSGVTVGDIDTGIVSQWAGFTSAYNGMGVNNVDTSLSATCLGGVCPTGAVPVDQNGHGTFTASEIVGGVQSVGLWGVAPASSLIAVQVLSANGSGYSNDIANGIIYAANNGAKVLNLSLGPSGTAKQQAAFYSSIAGAVNYAASLGVTLVFAGGNNHQNLAGGTNITGFTDTAITHMIFMGSTTAKERLSSFSNKPGSGGFVSTSGKFYAYKNMWMMADGENIWGASTYNTPQYGYTYITQMSGTSMAAPQATGAVALLEAKWPILFTNGTAAQLLESTATDMGTRGADTTYGDGFLNLTNAFKPSGTLTAKTAGGQSVTISSANGGTSTGGAFGSLSKVTSLLSNYTVFDSYQRNFTANLSGLVTTRPNISAVAQTVTAPVVSVGGAHFADGSSLSFGSAESTVELSPVNGDKANHSWYVSFSDAAGTTVAGGAGFPAAASFDEALWGSRTPVAGEVNALNSTNALTSLADGGSFFAYGTPASSSGSTRVAISYAQTQNDDVLMGSWVPNSNAINFGLSTDVMDNWKAGLTLGILNEHNGLLGTTSYTGSPLNFGDNNRSVSVGLSSVFSLAEDTDIIVDAAIARSAGASYSDGIISGTSPLYSASMGLALAERNTIEKDDSMTFSLKSPLRAYYGSADVAMSTVDAFGEPVITTRNVGLTPNGTEVDLTAVYQAPVRRNIQWNFSVEGSHDPQNIAGTSDVTTLATMKLSF